MTTIQTERCEDVTLLLAATTPWRGLRGRNKHVQLTVYCVHRIKVDSRRTAESVRLETYGIAQLINVYHADHSGHCIVHWYVCGCSASASASALVALSALDVSSLAAHKPTRAILEHACKQAHGLMMRSNSGWDMSCGLATHVVDNRLLNFGACFFALLRRIACDRPASETVAADRLRLTRVPEWAECEPTGTSDRLLATWVASSGVNCD